MPTLTLETNVKVPNPKEFILEMSKFSAELLQKPEKYILVTYQYNENVSFAESFDPTFRLTVISLDNIKAESTEAYSKDLFAFLNKTLRVPGDRGYIVFHGPDRAFIGHEGTTFAQIFGK